MSPVSDCRSEGCEFESHRPRYIKLCRLMTYRAFSLCARQGTLTWRCKSSMDPTAGTISRTARVSVVRLNLKEAAGKTLARRIGIAYKAVMSDEKADIFEVR